MNKDINSAELIASHLLESEAVKLSPHKPFTWASGWKSPIYCDNRITLSFPQMRKDIRDALAHLIKEQYPEVELIAGVATGAIAQGVLIAEILGLPFVYVRPEPKKHGRGNQVEGVLKPGQKTVVVEDLISTGNSSLKSVEALKGEGAEVLGMVAIFTYGFKVAEDNFTHYGVKLDTLTNYNKMIDQAIIKNYISESDRDLLSAWRLSPESWGN